MGAAAAVDATHQVEVAGLVLRVEASPADLELVARLVGDRAAPGPADAVIRFTPEGPAMPAAPPDFEGPYGDHWDDGRTHRFRHHWGLTAEVGADSATLGGPAAGHDRWVTVRNSMLFVLARLFDERGRFMVHGGAVRRGDDTVLVLGESGSGKSTLTFAASRHGWSVLGDDMVVVDRVDGVLRVQGIPRVPSLPGDVAAASRIDGPALPADERERIELHDFDLDVRPAPVRGVLVCGHGERDGRLRALTGAEALQALVPAFVFSALPGPVARWFPVAMALGRLPCAELHHASDHDARIAEAGRLLEEFRTGALAHTPNLPAATSAR
jgi:hypothetical protein